MTTDPKALADQIEACEASGIWPPRFTKAELDLICAALRAPSSAEAMREAAAKLCESAADRFAGHVQPSVDQGLYLAAAGYIGSRNGARFCAERIRALSPDPGPAPVEGWRKIETAPTEGRFLVAQYAPTNWQYYVAEVRIPEELPEERRESFRRKALQYARAWMPLPSPPAEPSRDAQKGEQG